MHKSQDHDTHNYKINTRLQKIGLAMTKSILQIQEKMLLHEQNQNQDLYEIIMRKFSLFRHRSLNKKNTDLTSNYDNYKKMFQFTLTTVVKTTFQSLC